MSFSNELKSNNLSLWNKAHVEHPFVLGMKDGSLEFNKFKFYMIQDYKFLIEYCRVISIAISKAKSFEFMSFLSNLLNETLNSEMKLHESFCDDFGIKKSDLINSKSALGTQSYCNYLLSIAYKFESELIACSLLPCQWGYDEIGRNLLKDNQAKEESFHKRWINAYNDPEYQNVTTWLINYVDSIKEKVDNKIANEIFEESLQQELKFWDSAWDQE